MPAPKVTGLIGYGWGIAVICVGGGLLLGDEYTVAALFIVTGFLLIVWGRWRRKQPD